MSEESGSVDHRPDYIADLSGIEVGADGLLTLYLKQARATPLLTAKEVIILAKRIEDGKKAVRRLKQPEGELTADQIAVLKQ